MQAKNLLKSLNEVGPFVYTVEYTSPFFSGPDKVLFCEPNMLSKLQSKLMKVLSD
jgi:hypothetical protein